MYFSEVERMFNFTLQEEDKKKVRARKYTRSVKIMARVLIIVICVTVRVTGKVVGHGVCFIFIYTLRLKDCVAVNI